MIVLKKISTISGAVITDHGALTGLDDDDHTQYSLADGTRAFSATVSGVTPTDNAHLTTKNYVDTAITTATGSLTVDHSALDNLDYASSGHTGFQPTGNYVTDTELTTTSGDIVSQIPTDYYTTGEVDTISGSLSAEIDSDISTHAALTDAHHPQSHTITSHSDVVDATGAQLEELTGGGDTSLHIHDSRYYTETEVDTISGSLSSEIDSDITTHASSADHDGRYYTETEVDALLVTVSGVSDKIYEGYTSVETFGTTESGSVVIKTEGLVEVPGSGASESFYYTGYSTSDWTNPGNMVDGNISTYAVVDVKEITFYHVNNTNNVPSSRPETITKVELRGYTYHVNPGQTGYIRPKFTGGDGDWASMNPQVPFTSPSWSNWVDVTDDTNSPTTWTWADVNSMDSEVRAQTRADGDEVNVSKIEIRATYQTTVLVSGTVERARFDSDGLTLQTGVTADEISNDTTLADESTSALVTEYAIKSYVDDEVATLSGSIVLDHGALTGLDDDDHSQYIPTDATRGFTATVSGIDPTEDHHLATKFYIDNEMATISGGTVQSHSNLTNLDADDHTQYHTDARGDARYYQKSEIDKGNQTISGGVDQQAINFNNPFPDTNYSLTTNLTNTVDSNPCVYPYIVGSKTASSFTVHFQGDIDSNNYVLEWIAMEL